jgi:VacB/RNase II family 3'-5' exoribonuclease
MIERVVTPERLDAHKLIEEFMIQANVAAAETLEAERSPLIYRVHEAPAPEKVVALAEFLKTIGISAPKGQVMKPAHFNRILVQAAGKEYQHLVNEVVLRTQSQAVYSPDNRGHFGLNLRRYAHFTSPIRRYADLIVHRAWSRCMAGETTGCRTGTCSTSTRRPNSFRRPSAAPWRPSARPSTGWSRRICRSRPAPSSRRASRAPPRPVCSSP